VRFCSAALLALTGCVCNGPHQPLERVLEFKILAAGDTLYACACFACSLPPARYPKRQVKLSRLIVCVARAVCCD
jgi:hypothetical protein